MIKKNKCYFIEEDILEEAIEKLKESFSGEEVEYEEIEFFSYERKFIIDKLEFTSESESIRVWMKSKTGSYEFSNYYFIGWLEEYFSSCNNYEQEEMEI